MDADKTEKKKLHRDCTRTLRSILKGSWKQHPKKQHEATAVRPTVYIYIYSWLYFGWVLWDINHCWLSDAKSYLYIYVLYIHIFDLYDTFCR